MEVLGIDIGGTGIKGAIVNVETGELVTERHRIATPSGAKPNDVAKVVKELVAFFSWKGKVGCGFPAIISNGVAKSCGNIDKSWVGTSVEGLFGEVTGLEFSVANDADAAAMAEINFGAGKDVKGLVVVITLGTGLGSGVFYNGQLVPNFELGAVPYKNYKKYEHYAADSIRKKEELSYEKWGKRVNKFLNFVVGVCSPDMIILGGGVSKKMEKFEKHLKLEIPVVPAKFQNNAGIIGAAMVAK